MKVFKQLFTKERLQTMIWDWNSFKCLWLKDYDKYRALFNATLVPLDTFLTWLENSQS